MQTSQQPKLADWEILESVAQYLNLSDLFKTATLSKQFNYSLRSYFRKHILPKNSLSNNNSNELSIAKKIFQRQIRIYRIEDKFSKTQVPNLILKGLQAGSTYTLLETYQNEKVFTQNDQLLSKSQLKTYIKLPKKMDGHIVQLIGDFLYVIQENKINKLSFVPNQAQMPFKQIDCLLLEAEISQIKVSQTHIFAITKNTFQENKLFAISLKDFKSYEVFYEINEQQSKTKVIDSHNLSVGANTAYYISAFKVYQLDIENSKEPKLLKSLKDKNIRKIINGAKHFFALEKMGKLTQEWETPDVIAWANKQGYEDYVKIFKSEKVTGKTLLNMDKKYMEDVLGLINVKLQQRLQVMLEENNTQKQQDCSIWGWGRNDKSQLGLNPSNPMSNPHKIKLPQGYNLLHCSNNITLIHSKKTGTISVNDAQNGKAIWVPIFENIFNLWSIRVYKDVIFALCPVEKDHIAQQFSQVPVHHKKQKLRTAKNIIDKIEWDQNLEGKQFRVGYLDKFTGILEISFDELQRSTQIKDYRIEYFKKNGEIVWSKKDRIDIV